MTPCPGNLLPPRVHYREPMASDLGDNRLRNRNDDRPNTPGRVGLRSATIALAHESSDGCERGDRWTDGVPVWACRAEESRLPNDPEKVIGRLTQDRDKSITSVAARVSGSGCAKLRKTGRKPRQSPRKREPRGPAPGGSCVSRSCCAGASRTPTRRASEGVGLACRPRSRVGLVWWLLLPNGAPPQR